MEEKQKCPNCLKELVSIDTTDINSRPNVGDFTVCLNCGNINEFDINLNVIETPSNRLKELKLLDVNTFLTLINISNKIKNNNGNK